MPGGNPPPFSFWRPKKKTAVEPSKEKTLVAAQLRARNAPYRAAGCGPKRSCSVNGNPYENTGGAFRRLPDPVRRAAL